MTVCRRLRLKCDGTRAETRFCLSAKWMSPFKSAGTSVQSTTGSRGVRISGSNAGYTIFRGSEWYWLPTPFASFPFTFPPVCHRVPSGFNWTLLLNFSYVQSNEFSLSFSSTTFQTCSYISDLLSEVANFQHHKIQCSKCSTLLVSSLNLSPICW